MHRARSWMLATLFVTTLVVAPFVYYRSQYEHARRFRVVTPGVLYRSGQMTAAGLEEMIQRHHLRTVVNFQNELPDPPLATDLTESELGTAFYQLIKSRGFNVKGLCIAVMMLADAVGEGR